MRVYDDAGRDVGEVVAFETVDGVPRLVLSVVSPDLASELEGGVIQSVSLSAGQSSDTLTP